MNTKILREETSASSFFNFTVATFKLSINGLHNRIEINNFQKFLEHDFLSEQLWTAASEI